MPSFIKFIFRVWLAGFCVLQFSRAATNEPAHVGFFYDKFPLTLAPGERTEIFGPAYYQQIKETERTWAIPVLTLSHTEDPVTESEEFDFAYPFLTYDRFGQETRWQFFQLFSFAGSHYQNDTDTHRFTIYPLYFSQRSPTDTNLDYTAVVPFYGHLDHRLFKDQIDFVMFPGYAKTQFKGVTTYNMPYPIFHLRYGEGLHGWQFWPLMGREHKEITTFTNDYQETKTNAGHESLFVLWPFFTQSTNSIGTDNVIYQQALLPFYSLYRSPLRDSTSYGWPFGVTRTTDREKKFTELDVPWPFIIFAHRISTNTSPADELKNNHEIKPMQTVGNSIKDTGKDEQRIFPFYSQAHNDVLRDVWYCWPVYKYNRVLAPPLERTRTRILFFLYSDTEERSTETGRWKRRQDFWPFYLHRRDFNGNERLQMMAIMEPIFPSNKSIERDFGQLYSFWRAEKNPKTGAASQSLLWNLYRRETAPAAKKISLLFGLFQYQSDSGSQRWRVCYIPFAKPRPVWPADNPTGR